MPKNIYISINLIISMLMTFKKKKIYIYIYIFIYIKIPYNYQPRFLSLFFKFLIFYMLRYVESIFYFFFHFIHITFF